MAAISDSAVKKVGCDQCHDTEKTLLRCMRCFQVAYCSKECQKRHWDSHRTVCVELSFSQMLKDIKPYEGQDFSYNLYLCTNELNCDKTYEMVRKKVGVHKVVIAVSGFFGLNLFALSQSAEYLLLIDISQRTEYFWLFMLALMPSMTTKEKAFKEIKNHLSEHRNMYFSGDETGYDTAIFALEKEMKEGVSWLVTGFKKVIAAFAANRITFIRLNLCEDQPLGQVKATLKLYKLGVEILYLSNTFEIANKFSDDKNYAKGVESLIDRKVTLLVDTEPRHCEKCFLDQRAQVVTDKVSIHALFAQAKPSACNWQHRLVEVMRKIL